MSQCDETLPCCKRCHRRRETCSYLQDYGPGLPRGDHHQHLQLTPSQAGSPSRGSPTPPEPSSYSIDLELTHFYLVHTYKTLWGREEAQLVWRDVIFPNSIHHPSLRNGIFAMAAMHRLSTSPDLTAEQRAVYRTTALQKQTAALEGFVRLLHSLDSVTVEVALPMSMLVAQWAFASKSLPPELNILSVTMDLSPSFESVPPFAMDSTLVQFLELLRRVQPVHHVLEQSRDTLMAGSLKPLMWTPKPEDLPPLPADTQRALDSLRRHLEAAPSLFEGDDPVRSLENLFRLSLVPQWGELISGWIVRVPEPFVRALRERDHAALTILAYWAASFYPINERWWARGWSMALIEEVSGTVEEPWAGLMRWPRGYIGLTDA